MVFAALFSILFGFTQALYVKFPSLAGEGVEEGVDGAVDDGEKPHCTGDLQCDTGLDVRKDIPAVHYHPDPIRRPQKEECRQDYHQHPDYLATEWNTARKVV